LFFGGEKSSVDGGRGPSGKKKKGQRAGKETSPIQEKGWRVLAKGRKGIDRRHSVHATARRKKEILSRKRPAFVHCGEKTELVFHNPGGDIVRGKIFNQR